MLVLSALAIGLCGHSHEFAGSIRTSSTTTSYERSNTHRLCGEGRCTHAGGPDFYGGYGSPFFNFYAPLVYAIAGALTLLLGSAVVALKCYCRTTYIHPARTFTNGYCAPSHCKSRGCAGFVCGC